MYFFCFPIICLPAIWKSSFLWNGSYLCHLWYLQGKRLSVISSFCRQLLLRADYSFVHFTKVWVFVYPKWLCDVVQPLDMYQKRSFFMWSLLVKSLCASLWGVCFPKYVKNWSKIFVNCQNKTVMLYFLA